MALPRPARIRRILAAFPRPPRAGAVSGSYRTTSPRPAAALAPQVDGVRIAAQLLASWNRSRCAGSVRCGRHEAKAGAGGSNSASVKVSSSPSFASVSRAPAGISTPPSVCAWASVTRGRHRGARIRGQSATPGIGMTGRSWRPAPDQHQHDAQHRPGGEAGTRPPAQQQPQQPYQQTLPRPARTAGAGIRSKVARRESWLSMIRESIHASAPVYPSVSIRCASGSPSFLLGEMIQRRLVCQLIGLQSPRDDALVDQQHDPTAGG